MDWKLFGTTFGTLFVAELGDKTQLACMLFATKSQKPWTVFLASSLALILVSFLGVMVADVVCRYVPAEALKKVAAGAFVVMGILIWLDKI